jgi:hypothetical protein
MQTVVSFRGRKQQEKAQASAGYITEVQLNPETLIRRAESITGLVLCQ